VPVRIRRILARGLAARPEARHADMRTLLDALERAAARPWRRWAAMIAVVLAVTVGLFVRGLWLQQQDIDARLAALAVARDEACGGAESQLAGFWDPVRAQAVARAFAATGLEFAAHDAAQATALLDRHAAGWSAAHRELCLAHQRGDLPDNLHERGLACLYERRAALGSLVDVLEQADRRIVERSSETISGLPGFAGCTDPARLLRDGSSAATPEQAQAFARLRQEMAQISSQAGLRTGDALRQRAARALEAARETGDPGLLGRALRLRAELEFDAEQFDAALATLRDDWWLTLSGGADLEALHAAEDLAFQLAVTARADEAEVWLRNGRALLARLGGGEGEETWLLSECEALIAHFRGQPTKVIAIVEPLLAEIASVYGDTVPQHIRLQINVSGAYEQIGDYGKALDGLRQALRSREALHGTEHPALIVPLESMGVTLDNLGQFAEARALYRRALDLTRRFRPNSALRLAYLENNLGESLYREEKYAEALREFEAARDAARAAAAPGDPLVGFTEVGRGNALLRLGRLDEATAAYAAADAELRVLPADHPAQAYTRVGLARLALMRDRIGEATRLVGEASALRKADNSPPSERAELALLRAELQWRSPATRAPARASAEEAVALLRQAGPGFLRPLAEAEAWLAAHPAP
jgi:tetratricopeptide (TPR) repeat protein